MPSAGGYGASVGGYGASDGGYGASAGGYPASVGSHGASAVGYRASAGGLRSICGRLRAGDTYSCRMPLDMSQSKADQSPGPRGGGGGGTAPREGAGPWSLSIFQEEEVPRGIDVLLWGVGRLMVVWGRGGGIPLLPARAGLLLGLVPAALLPPMARLRVPPTCTQTWRCGGCMGLAWAGALPSRGGSASVRGST